MVLARHSVCFRYGQEEIVKGEPDPEVQAVELLRPGGVLVYSTCTVTLAENEEQVAWALETFPSLQLQHQDPQVGGEGMLGAGLSPEQLKRLQRFDPSAVQSLDRDIGSLRDASIEDLGRCPTQENLNIFVHFKSPHFALISSEEQKLWL
ncbi:NSUN6 [Cervus elaphus hippelaphus]|uniref:NSUN6 n=1 Tax=Cervus elaphus hippelaphus TaxID=46360 RepID=A0A212CAZ3_CEREH|nr:NSUN6 [Cervus elaphus hippelaphus]